MNGIVAEEQTIKTITCIRIIVYVQRGSMMILVHRRKYFESIELILRL